ncbi:MAG TPA: sugar phosphate isomerase/epimerase family protein [Acidobacteriota bacterium]|nr:sugar phosphate isomerase/epimerase family protein [Acidobacteriota bacterium]
MARVDRRSFIQGTAKAAMVSTVIPLNFLSRAVAPPAPRRMTMTLSCGAIGVAANQREAVELASRHGFESVEVDASYLASLSGDQLAEFLTYMKSKNISFGAAGLPVEFRQDEGKFNDGMKRLPNIAAALARAGVSRVSTWIMPCHDSLTYVGNFRQHTARLREVARILADQQIRLGLEYVGAKTLWTSKRYPFLHTMAEMKDLIGEMGSRNVGFLLDSFHWWNAGETEKDILSLGPEQVVSVDLNDAPAGIPKEQQVDGRRELPCATGVIPVAEFLNALNQIGYDGPVRAEPFNKAVNALPKEEACAVAAKSLKQAFSLIK